jgi:hypothetical protein
MKPHTKPMIETTKQIPFASSKIFRSEQSMAHSWWNQAQPQDLKLLHPADISRFLDQNHTANQFLVDIENL